MTVAGASRFINAATLANQQGLAAQSPTVLGETSTASLLDTGRGAFGNNGIGLSANARALNDQFFGRTADVNSLFSLAAGPDATIESAQQQILALRAGLSDSQLAPSLRADAVGPDDGSVAASDLGQEVDETA